MHLQPYMGCVQHAASHITNMLTMPAVRPTSTAVPPNLTACGERLSQRTLPTLLLTFRLVREIVS